MINFSVDPTRKENRQQLVRPVYFQGEADNSRFAFTMNYSDCGLCIITNKSVSTGETVKFQSRYFWDEPREAIVVWKKEVNYNITRVGLALCSADQQALAADL